MDVQVEKTGAYLVKMTVTFAPSEVDRAFDDAMRRVQKKAQLPGFRPGKIPKALLNRHFGTQMHNEVQNHLLEDSVFNALEQNGVDVIAMPKVTPGPLRQGAEFRYTAEVEVRPEITLAQYKGLAVPKVPIEVTPDEVAAHIDELRKTAAQTVPVMDRTTAAPGDFVLLDYVGTLDGVPFDGGSAENALVELGATDYIPGFAEGLQGVEVPGQRDVAVTFPADYGQTHLAGKTANFAMTCKELKVRELPQKDDAFAQDMGSDSLEALQTQVHQTLVARKEHEAKGEQRRHILKALVAANPFEVPPSMVDNQVERMVASAHARVEQMTGQKIELDAPAVADLRGSSRDDAEFQIRSGLLLMQISKAEHILVSDADIDAEVEKVVHEAGQHAQRARQFYQAEERRSELRYRLLEDRTVAFLLAEATLQDPIAAS